MVDLAKSMQPDLSFAVGDAESLDYPDNTFDAAAMNFGILHLERPEAALKETFRVLKPGGKFAFSIWGTPDEALGFDIVLKAIKEHGDPAVPLPQGPPFFRFSDRAESTKEMEKAGFSEIRIEKISMLWNLASAEDFFNAFLHGTPRTGGILRAQTAQQLASIKKAITQSLAIFQDERSNKLQIPMVALVVSGTKTP
jgi:SAM-dependent methyltransferase